MRKLFIVIVVSLSFLACVSRYKTQNLSELTVNSETKNRNIVDRYADYGDGRPDGCIIQPGMSLRLEVNNRLVVGNIRDATSGLRLSYVSVSIDTKDDAKFVALSDSLGAFKLEMPGKVSKIELKCVGYRTFFAKL